MAFDPKEPQVFSTAEVTDEQLHAMWYACSEISSQPNAREACRRLSERLSQIISAPTVVFRRDLSPWTLVVSSPAPGEDRAIVPPPAASQLEQLVPSPDVRYLPIGGQDNPDWTPVPLDEDLPSQSLLLLPGDWHAGPAAQWLPRFARTASMALRLATARQAARKGEGLAAIAYSVARKLGQLTSARVLHQFIVDAAARSANARLGGLSVYLAKEGAIAVSATYGYPSESVGHVRIVPGSGIIGGVFSSKKPLLVRDTTRVPGLTPRSQRYQTASFMAIPIVAGEDALGVVTLADRTDGRPFTRNDLAAVRVITALSSLALVREQLTRMRDELAHTAAIDPLTGMFNRRYLHTRLDAELERSRRSGLPVALLMLDVDAFKSINDRMGHQTGDAVLRKVSDIIRRSVRASDVCTRYGGDEFAIVVTENAVGAAQTAERIRHRVDAFRWDALGLPQTLQVTVSIGVSIGDVGEASEGLIGRADQNLYLAKARGRNCVHPAENRGSG
jgi:diguanylate cyclase (GGDEF)-like protein